ncbi:helix-turn-helix transcriptional regulator [Paenibacillus silvisoli]|uniref:helix-turn-helix transcriptional regulator n=1 Tax=Paenibacillus silvisoli TaxID=3110539 RepID=UPI0028055CD9|nr:AraC family transcriptional regulator [Paenibacillus silvisoli]
MSSIHAKISLYCYFRAVAVDAMKLIDNVLKSNPYLFSPRTVTTDQAGYTIFHAHQGLELLYVEQGEGHFILENRIMPIQPQTLYLFQPFQLHRVHALASPQKPYIRSILVVEPLFLEPYLSAFPEFKTFFGRLWKEELTEQAYEIPDLANQFDLIDRELQPQNPSQTLERIALGTISLLRKLRQAMEASAQTAESRPTRKTALTEQAMTWLDATYQEEFSLTRIAEELHISPYYLSHLFKQDTGNSMTEYLIAKRLREACLLLQSSEMSIAIVGERVGFATPSHFIHTFKKHIGMTPFKYRKEGRAGKWTVQP